MNDEKIKQVREELAIISQKIEENTGIGDEAGEELKKLCEEKTRLVALLNYLK